MKMYKVFTAAGSEEFARLQCELHKPFEAPMVGWMGVYEERGWWFVRSPESWEGGQVRCVDPSEAELVVSSLERNIVCGGQSGDLMCWSYVDKDGWIWSWVKFIGMGVGVSVGCYMLRG